MSPGKKEDAPPANDFSITSLLLVERKKKKLIGPRSTPSRKLAAESPCLSRIGERNCSPASCPTKSISHPYLLSFLPLKAPYLESNALPTLVSCPTAFNNTSVQIAKEEEFTALDSTAAFWEFPSPDSPSAIAS